MGKSQVVANFVGDERASGCVGRTPTNIVHIGGVVPVAHRVGTRAISIGPRVPDGAAEPRVRQSDHVVIVGIGVLFVGRQVAEVSADAATMTARPTGRILTLPLNAARNGTAATPAGVGKTSVHCIDDGLGVGGLRGSGREGVHAGSVARDDRVDLIHAC